MSDLPKDYVRIRFPTFTGSTIEQVKQRWETYVYDRARIKDPQFHDGNTEAIRLIVEYREEEIYPSSRWTRRVPIPGDWIEFRNFKDANAYVQTLKRLSK